MDLMAKCQDFQKERHMSKKVKYPKSQKEYDKHFGVFYKGSLNMYLSPTLALKQGITYEDLDKLKKLHQIRLELFEESRSLNTTSENRQLAERVEHLEFELQKAWKFTPDKKFHSWWFQVPTCKCPKLDNLDSLGTGFCVISGNCPLHGTDVEQKLYN